MYSVDFSALAESVRNSYFARMSQKFENQHVF
jgi:hypothetical protein